MKIVGLLPFRDEAPYLPLFIKSLRPLVDKIVALDDRSVDAGPDLLRDAGAWIVTAPPDTTFGARRAALLVEGRKVGGSHFVVVDADEAFSETFTRTGRQLIERLRVGEALAMPKRTLWKGSEQYRVGREYDLPLASIFRDNNIATYPDVRIHEARLPRALSNETCTLTPVEGEMIHFQFVAFRRSQVKQAWYRCKELLDGSSSLRINARYLTTLDGPFVRTRKMDALSISHLPPTETLVDLPPSWHLDELLAWIARYGPARFERLQIWHVPELAAAFEATEGRPPRPARITPHLTRLVGDAYGSGRAAFRRRLR